MFLTPFSFARIQPRFLLFIVSLLCLTLSSCSILWPKSKDDQQVVQEKTEADFFNDAITALKRYNLNQAIEIFGNMQARYPFGEYAPKAQLELMYAYSRNFDSELARNIAQRFIDTYPNHPNLDYAYYVLARMTYDSQQGTLERWFNLDISGRDIDQARQAFYEFSQLISRFPNSRFAFDARERMLEIKNRMAKYELGVIEYYMKRQAYIGVIKRSLTVIKNFQDSDAAKPALAALARAYALSGQEDLYQKTSAIYAAQYPGDEALTEELLVAYTVPKNHSWWEIISFGLIR